MDGQALIIEIGKRAKAKERASSGAPAEDEETEKSEEKTGDADSIKASAIDDIVKALGLKADDVDLPGLTSAMEHFAEACAVHATTKKKDAE